MSKSGAVSSLGRQGEAPPQCEREGFFCTTFNHTVLDCLFCLWIYSPVSIKSHYVEYCPFLGCFTLIENRLDCSYRLPHNQSPGRASTNVFSTLCVTFTCVAIGGNKHISINKKYEVKTSLYVLNIVNQ